MKKTLIFLLIAASILGLCSCSFDDAIEPVEFYYRQQSDPSSLPESVIAPETREASGHADDLTYLLSLYLRGPLDEDLESPFPAGCRLVSVRWDEKTLCVTLDSGFAALENIQQTVACACLAKTCFSLTDAAQVRILAVSDDNTRSVDITISPDSLFLEDDGSSIPQTTEEIQ